MNALMAIGAGGALGAIMRYGIMLAFVQWIPYKFPFGTLFINVLGSFLVGILYVLLVEKHLLSETWRLALMVGFLGAFTTFSAFSLESFHLLNHQFILAITYMLASVILCLLATFAGIYLARIV